MQRLIYLWVGLWAVFAWAGNIRIEPEGDPDLGQVFPGSLHELSFRVCNDGSDTVQLLRVQSGCGCAVARLLVSSLPAGGSTQVKVLFTAPETPGGLTREVYVTTDHAEARLLTARFQAVVLASTGREAGAATPARGDRVPGQVLVRYRRDRCDLRQARSRAARASLAGRFDCESMEIVQESMNLAVLRLRPNETIDDAMARLARHGDVLYVQPDHYLGDRAAAPNDPSFTSQWNLRNTGQSAGTAGMDSNILTAWDQSRGAGTIVAILDNGVRYTHPDFAGRLWDGSGCLDENGVFRGNCLHGWDYSGTGDNNPDAEGGDHGTHVAGIVAATANNNTNVAGLAPESTLMVVRSASYVESELIKGIYFAKYNGAKVINASWGWTPGSCSALTSGDYQALYEACADFPGVIAVAAGNGTRDHNGTSYFDTADFGHFIRSTNAANAMSIQQVIASTGTPAGPLTLDFAETGHSLLITPVGASPAAFTVLLTAGSSTQVSWISASRRLQVTFQQGVTTATQLISAINGAQVSLTASLATGVSATAVGMQMDIAAGGGGFYQRATAFYQDPLNADAVRLAIEALADGGTANNLTLRLRDSGAQVGGNAVATLVGNVLTADFDFGVTSSDVVANALNTALAAGGLYRAWPTLCFRPLPNIISVTAYDRTGTQLYDYGKNVDIAAPGKDIVSLGLTSVVTKTGTSMAAPHAAAAAAMVYSVLPGLLPGQIREAIFQHARCLPHGGFPLSTSGNGYCALTESAQLDVGSLLAALLVDDTYELNEDTMLSVAAPGILANDGLPVGPVTVITVVTPMSHGTLNLAQDGSFTYTPNHDFSGVDVFVYRPSQGQTVFEDRVVRITVNGINDAPVSLDDSYTLTASSLAVSAPGVLSNDTDVDGDTLTAMLATAPAAGDATVTLQPSGAFTVAIGSAFNGQTSFTYTVQDPGALSGGPATVSLTIVPVGVTNSYSMTEDGELTVAAPGVLGNDAGSTSALLTATLVTGPTHGVLNLQAGGGFTYTPAPDYFGNDTFSYKPEFPNAAGSVTAVTLTITGVPDAPRAVADAYDLTSAVLTVVAPGILANDIEPDGNSMTAVLLTPPALGTLSFNSNGAFTYTAGANFNGSDSFTYKVIDSTALESSPQTVTISAAALAFADSGTTPEDTMLTVAAPGVLGNDFWAGTLTVVPQITLNPTHGTVSLQANGAYTYTPSSNYNGADSFRYVLNDGSRNYNEVVVTLQVTAVNDAPISGIDIFQVNETYLAVSAPGVLRNDFDPEGNAMEAILVSAALHGTVQLALDGSFTYMTDGSFTGNDNFSYRARDSFGLFGPTTTVIITRTAQIAVEPVAAAVGEEGSAVFRVYLQQPTVLPVYFDYTTIAQSADAGGDFVAVTGSGLIGFGEIETTITIQLVDDEVPEDDEHFQLQLFNITNAQVENLQTEIWIVDNDVDAAVSRGWQLLGVPVHLPDDAMPLGADVAHSWSWLARYQAAIQKLPAGAPAGYWLEIPSDRQLHYSGGAETAATITLSRGWNLIAPWRDFSFTALAAVARGHIWEWDGRRYSKATALSRGRAYWLDAPQAGTFPVNP